MPGGVPGTLITVSDDRHADLPNYAVILISSLGRRLLWVGRRGEITWACLIFRGLRDQRKDSGFFGRLTESQEAVVVEYDHRQ